MRPACLSLYCQNTLGVTIWTKFPKHWQSNLADPLQGRVSLKSKHPLGLFCSESMNSFSLLPFTSGSSDWLLQLPRRKGTKQLSLIWILIPADGEKTACQSAPPLPPYTGCCSVRLQKKPVIRWAHHNIVTQIKSKVFCLLLQTEMRRKKDLGLQSFWWNNAMLLTCTSMSHRCNNTHVSCQNIIMPWASQALCQKPSTGMAEMQYHKHHWFFSCSMTQLSYNL